MLKVLMQTGRTDTEQQGGVVMLSGESLIELDELAELRREVAEITEPEPLYFTTA
jgi:hypothetical protein